MVNAAISLCTLWLELRFLGSWKFCFFDFGSTGSGGGRIALYGQTLFQFA